MLVKEGIAENLDISTITSSFRIADMGCSTGPNTFFAIENIIEAVKTKFKLHEQLLPEFQVFFNDHVSNDFNTLFNNLSSQSKCHYYAAGVPGSFHDRLFPRAFLHFVFSSSAVHWLSTVPKDVVDEKSLAWNKGGIYYTNAGDAVVEAYANQHAEDMGRFLSARAEEIASGGLMVLVVPPHAVLASETVKPTAEMDTRRDRGVRIGIRRSTGVHSLPLMSIFLILISLPVAVAVAQYDEAPMED